MDPNVAHAELMNMLDAIRSMEREGVELDGHQETFLESFGALDGWLRSGGFLPDAWHR